MGMLARLTKAIKEFGSPLLNVAGFLISLASLYVAFDGAHSANRIAAEALATARQANDIALGRIREPTILQFSTWSEDAFKFDFSSATGLERELGLYVSLSNDGKKAVEGAVLEVVGIEPLTYRVDNPAVSLRPLPSTVLQLTFNAAVQPAGAVHVDVRKPILQYLAKLAPQIVDKDALYSTTVNVVVTGKGLGEAVAVGAPSSVARRDRHLWTIVFKASVLDAEIAKKIMAEPSVPNRVYSP